MLMRDLRIFSIIIKIYATYILHMSIFVRMNLTTLGSRHETRVQCEHCGVYLCIANIRDCFKKYNTQSVYGG